MPDDTLPQSTELKESEPELRFSQEQYDKMGWSADTQQIRLLKEGSDRWNEWRKENAVTPQLDGAVLRLANLRGADLSGANVRGADLTLASLEGANLSGVDLSCTNLNTATLDGADLTRANLLQVDFTGARLVSAKLSGSSWGYATIGSNTNLAHADFSTHSALSDRSETIRIGRRNRLLNWGVIRRLGSLPLFGVSYVALIGALLTVTGIGFLKR